jgi:hypothetical protein
MTVIPKCHVNYVHIVMFIRYMIPSVLRCRLKSIDEILHSR